VFVLWLKHTLDVMQTASCMQKRLMVELRTWKKKRRQNKLMIGKYE